MLFYIIILAASIFYVFIGNDLVKSGGFYQRIQGWIGLIGGTLGILFSTVELITKYLLKW